jgi:nucleotide-binding universal stress UspA family protein
MRSDIQSILCIVDFSALSLDGLKLGIVLKRRFNSNLLVFHAVNVAGDQVCGSDYAHNKPRQLSHLAQARKQMERLLTSADGAVPLVVTGEPVEELVRLTSCRHVDLVIAPSRGISGFKRLYTGTIVERLVRRINCPVLIVRPPKKIPKSPEICLQQVVAGITSDGQSKDIICCAARISRYFDAHLHLVHIVEAPPDIENEPYEIAQQHLQTSISQDLLAAALTVNMQPDRVTTAVLTGTPGEVIDAYAAGIHAEMIVVGVRRTGILKKTLIGSTTEALLRHSPCCILTLPVEADFTSSSETS